MHPSFDKQILLYHKLTVLGGLNKLIFIRSLYLSLNDLCNYATTVTFLEICMVIFRIRSNNAYVY